MIAVAKPGPPKHEGDLLERIEAWKKELIEVEALGGPVMGEKWEEVAMLTMLAGGIKEKYK